LSFCKVVWRHYLDEVGKLYRTLWLIYPRHCTSFSIKIGQVFRSYDKKNLCVFYASQCVTTYSVLQRRPAKVAVVGKTLPNYSTQVVI